MARGRAEGGAALCFGVSRVMCSEKKSPRVRCRGASACAPVCPTPPFWQDITDIVRAAQEQLTDALHDRLVELFSGSSETLAALVHHFGVPFITAVQSGLAQMVVQDTQVCHDKER